jgi:hypothetical protein
VEASEVTVIIVVHWVAEVGFEKNSLWIDLLIGGNNLS